MRAMRVAASPEGKRRGRVKRRPAPTWQQERDRLLRDSGFVDLEDASGWMEPVIKPHGPIIGRQRTPAEIETLAEYYRCAGQLLHDHKFRTPVERRIWELHAEGVSYTRVFRTVKREIAAGTLPREKMYRRRVHATVTRLKAKMLGQTSERRKGGRKADPSSLRSEGMALHVRLSREAAQAMDHIRVVLKLGSAQEAIRHALLRAGKMTSG